MGLICTLLIACLGIKLVNVRKGTQANGGVMETLIPAEMDFLLRARDKLRADLCQDVVRLLVTADALVVERGTLPGPLILSKLS